MQSSPASTTTSPSTTHHSPELRKSMISPDGRLILRPEFAHERLDYREDATSGAYKGAWLNILDNDPLDVYARAKFNTLHHSVVKTVKWANDGFIAAKARLFDDMATSKFLVSNAYHAVATRARKRYSEVVAVPGRVNEKIEKENLAVKKELELVRLRLVEARLQVQEARLRARAHGVSFIMQMAWILFFVVCLVGLAWVLDFAVVDTGFDAFEEWLLGDI